MKNDKVNSKVPLEWSAEKDQHYIDSARVKREPTKELLYFNKLSEYFDKGKVKSFLSVGAGTGETEIFFSKMLGCAFGFQDYSPSLEKIFREKLEAEGVSGSLRESHVDRFEESSFIYTYDLIFSFHAWYYISIEKQIFQKLKSLLNPGGKVLVVLHRRDNLIFALNELKSDPLTISADDFADAAKESGIFKVTMHEWIDHWPKDGFIKDGELTQKALGALAFSLSKKTEDLTKTDKEVFIRILNKHEAKDGFKLEFGIVELS